MADTLQFDAGTHTYTLGGKVLPSVTQVLSILDQYEGVPAVVLERAREFGQHVHLAVELDIRRQLDEAALDPALRPYLAAWRKFHAECGFKVHRSEWQLMDRKLGYAGTLDLYGELNKRSAVIDIKSGIVPMTVGPQTAAYANALKAPEIRRPFRYCLQLMPDDYRLHKLTDPADWSVFVSCLNVWKWRNRK